MNQRKRGTCGLVLVYIAAMNVPRPATAYASWSTDALKGYIVLVDALASGATSNESLRGYEERTVSVRRELAYRISYDVSGERSLAFPSETATTGSLGG